MPTATKSRRVKTSFRRGNVADQFRQYDESKSTELLDKWDQLPLLVDKSGLDEKSIATVDAVLLEVGKTRKDLTEALDDLLERKTDFSKIVAVDRENIKTLAAQIAEIESQKQAAVAVFDDQIAPLEREKNQLLRALDQAERAEDRLVASAPEPLRDDIQATKAKIQQLKRLANPALMPIMGEDLVR